jgi:hypothetical protein
MPKQLFTNTPEELITPSQFDIFESNGELSTAIFSKDRMYRYVLSWKTGIPGTKKIVWIMLNPSTANAFKLDPTLTRCLYRSRHHKANEMIILNLFAMRSPYPKDLYKVDDPIGPSNDAFIKRITSLNDVLIVCAWGSHVLAKERSLDVLRGIESMSTRAMYCVGLTKDNQPKHPLHVSYSEDLRPFEFVL